MKSILQALTMDIVPKLMYTTCRKKIASLRIQDQSFFSIVRSFNEKGGTLCLAVSLILVILGVFT